MKKTFVLLLTMFVSLLATAQYFEGKISYTNTYKSKMPAVTDEQFTNMMGATQEYYIRGGDYKSITNGTYVQWQLYVNADNKLYTKTAGAEKLLWNDGAVNADEVLSAVINKAVTTVLGYQCDELVLTCKSGVQKYYFNTTLGIDAALYARHSFGNWYEFVSRARALPLKSIIDTPQFQLESIATQVTSQQMAPSFFSLPANVQTMKNPY